MMAKLNFKKPLLSLRCHIMCLKKKFVFREIFEKCVTYSCLCSLRKYFNVKEIEI